MASDAEVLKWQNFFLEAGIPRSIATKYSKSFAVQRMQHSILGELDKSTLKELGITAVGDQLAVLRHVRGLQQKKAKVTESNEDKSLDKKKRVPAREERSPAHTSEPDRDDKSRARLPAPTALKTKEITQRHRMLKSAGISKRGSDNVRQLDKLVTKERLKTGTTAVINEVSSTTDDIYGRLGVRGLVSDQLSPADTYTRIKERSARKAPTDLFQRALNESVAEPVFHVRIASVTDRITRPERFRRPALTSARMSLNGVAGSAIVKTRYVRAIPRGGARARLRGGSVFDRLG